jgi:hypothetical protein
MCVSEYLFGLHALRVVNFSTSFFQPLPITFVLTISAATAILLFPKKLEKQHLLLQKPMARIYTATFGITC